MGRPRTTVKERIEKISFDIDKICVLIGKGFTDQDIADSLGVSERTVNRWKEDELFVSALKKAKDFRNSQVEQSLFKRAMGYEYDEIHFEKTGRLIAVKDATTDEIKFEPQYKKKVITKQVIPSELAQIFWLKNTKPLEWRDKKDINVSGRVNLISNIPEPATEPAPPSKTKNRLTELIPSEN